MARQHVNTADVRDGVINISGAGTNELVAAPGAQQAVRVMGYVFTCPSGAAVTWKSGTTAKSGAMILTTGVSAPSPGPGGRQFQCTAGQALNLLTDTVGNYGGHFTYQIVEVPL